MVSLVIFIGLISFIGMWAFSIANDQGVDIDQTYHSNISSNLNDMYTLSEGMKNTTYGTGAGTQDSSSNFLGGALSAIKLTFSSLNTIEGISRESASVFMAPTDSNGAGAIFIIVILTLMFIIITFAIISLIFRKNA